MEQNSADSCGLATRPIHRRERSGRGGLGGSPLESEAVLRNIGYLEVFTFVNRLIPKSNIINAEILLYL